MSSDLLRALTIVDVSPNAYGSELYDTWAGQRLLDMYPVRLPYWEIHGAQPPRWSLRVARSRADWWVLNRPNANEPLVLLGAKVCAAFGISEPEWLSWYARPSNPHPMIAFPHPLLNGWWHKSDNATRATELLGDVATKKLPLKPKKAVT